MPSDRDQRCAIKMDMATNTAATLLSPFKYLTFAFL
jgi:hypothetical protein